MHWARQALDRRLRKSVGIDLDLFAFFLRQRVMGFDVPIVPHFECGAVNEWFAGALRAAKRYLEFGTGGSTYLAAKLGTDFIAVDSDPYFLRSVQRRIRKDGYENKSRQVFKHANIGMTEYWGRPFRPWRASPLRLERFRRYSDPPVECRLGGPLPDLVLVDGRFRIACALKALKMLRNEKGWRIVVDDYVGRSAYSVIEEFAEIERYVGTRMVVFNRVRSFDDVELDRAILAHEVELD